MTGQVLRLLRRAAFVLACTLALHSSAAAQQPTGDLNLPKLPPGTTPQQALELVRSRPDLAAQLRARISASGLTPDQIRSRLRALNYPESLLDDYLAGADTTVKARPSGSVLEAVRNLGVVSAADVDTLRALTDSALSLADSARADSLSESSAALKVFGLDVFRRTTNQFQPVAQGPVDDGYRLGAGDELVLILSGDVEQSYSLDVTRDGFVVIPQVGQLSVANLTMSQLRALLADRLGRVYSGIRRGGGGSTQFDVTVAKLRNIQVYVVGDVARPGAYQVSAAGTVLSALYAAGGPSLRGSFRSIAVRRGAATLATLDLYDYLLRGDTRSDVRLQSGDVVFVPPVRLQVKISGAVLRPAIYELQEGETARTLIAGAGGFAANALQSRLQVHRIVPPSERRPTDLKDRIVVELEPAQFAVGGSETFPMVAGDSVTVFEVRDRVRNVVEVKGSVWVEGPVGFTRGMRLSDALRLAGGLKPDFYTGAVLVSRLRSDSTRAQLRSAFADTTGKLTQDLVLEDDDLIEVFSRNAFRPERFIIVTGAVRKPGRVDYREGMTLRDALLAVGGVSEDALLSEAEIARLPTDKAPGEIARTSRVALDSTYLFERDASGRYQGPPGLAAAASGAGETTLLPYDNVLIFRQPEWELQRPVVITGQVKFPGKYGLRTRTERLSDLIERAGGLTKEAYSTGIEFYRASGRRGRIGVDLPRVLKEPAFRDNLILVSGDSIVIPEFNPVVSVTGAVNAPVAVAFVPGKSLRFYLGASGGPSRLADTKRAYVTQPNGKVESGLSRKPLPGSTIFVPAKDPNSQTSALQVLATVTPLLASLATVLVVALTR